jgi:hypothetical protein
MRSCCVVVGLVLGSIGVVEGLGGGGAVAWGEGILMGGSGPFGDFFFNFLIFYFW